MGVLKQLALVGAIVAALCLHAEQERRCVLVVHSYHVGMPWADGVTKGLIEGLNGQAELVITQLDIKRFPGPDREPAMEHTVSSKARACDAALIIAVDDYAYRFCVDRREKLFPGKPIVFCGVNFWDRRQVPGVTGLVESIDILSTLRLARRLQPHASRLIVVNDGTETGQANKSALDRALAGMTDLQVLQVGSGSFQETEDLLRTLSETNDIVLLLSWNKDSLGHVRSYEEAIARARMTCPAPLYGVWDFYFGHGIVGGSLMDGTTHGREAANLVSLVLAGGRPDDIPIVTRCKSRLVVDERELRRFNIDAELVPEGAEITFRQTSVWREYRTLILSVAFVLVAQGLTIAFLCIVRIRQRRAEASLRRSEERLAVTLSSIGDAVLATDIDGKIILMNPVAERLTGWLASEAVGRHYADITTLVQGDNRTPVPNPISEVIRSKEAVSIPTPNLLRHRAGGERLVLESAAPIRDARQALLGVVMVIKDVTDQRQLEEQLRHSQRMESIGLLAGGVAHDFNNILQVVKMSMQLARMPETEPAMREEMLQNVENAVAQASDLTRQLLAFGRRQRLEMKALDLSQLVSGMLKMIRRLIGTSIDVGFVPAPLTFWIRADQGQIEQVILNLCINARDAMPKGGRLVLELSKASFAEQDVIDRPWLRSGSFIQLSISDTGTGMDKETLSRIFEPFFTTKPAGKGTGLGLSVVQGVVQQHQGMVTVYSEPGQGTTFRIYLPESGRPDSTPAKAEPGAIEVRKDLAILLAEDDAIVRGTTTTMLRRYGYRVVPVSDGQEACEYIENGHPCDLVIMDIMMPRLGGIDAAERMLRGNPKLPIILCSGFSAKVISPGGFSASCRFVAKPYSSEELLRAISETAPFGRRTTTEAGAEPQKS